MSVVRLKVPFGENNFVERQDLSNLEYNSMIEAPTNGKVIIENHYERTKGELLNSEGNIINPKPKGFHPFMKIDPTSYTIFFVDTSKITGETGGNFQCKNDNIKELQYEKVLYRITYEFKVINSKRFLETMVSDEMNQYSRNYFREKIGKQIKLVIEEKVSKEIMRSGIEYFSTNITMVKSEIEKDLEEGNMWDKGIELSIIDLVIEENEKIKAMREDTELRKYQRNMSKEDK